MTSGCCPYGLTMTILLVCNEAPAADLEIVTYIVRTTLRAATRKGRQSSLDPAGLDRPNLLWRGGFPEEDLGDGPDMAGRNAGLFTGVESSHPSLAWEWAEFPDQGAKRGRR